MSGGESDTGLRIALDPDDRGPQSEHIVRDTDRTVALCGAPTTPALTGEFILDELPADGLVWTRAWCPTCLAAGRATPGVRLVEE